MRDSDNIQELVKLAPDFIGFIFYDKSKRFVTNFPEVNISSTIKKVGVFVNESITNIVDLIVKNKLDAVQLHGGESELYCEELRRSLSGVEVNEIENKSNQNMISTSLNHKIEIIKAFSVDENFDFLETKSFEQFCDLFIFDTKGKGYGGTGIKYDWRLLEKYRGKTPFLLSGGIRPTDVNSISDFQHPKCIGIDLNSGFEDAPGLKNTERLNNFMSFLRNQESQK